MRALVLPAILVAALAASAVLFGSREPAVSAAYAERKRDSAGTGVPLAVAQDMPVELAYAAIPHRRTAFRFDRSTLPPATAAYLAALFEITDAGVVERVSTQRALQRGDGWPPGHSNYDAILRALASLDTPEALLPVEGLIFEAIAEQRRYLEHWRDAGGPHYFDRGAPLVRSSHRKLIAAYERLMTLFGREDRHNKQAFFDHLCALDFI